MTAKTNQAMLNRWCIHTVYHLPHQTILQGNEFSSMHAMPYCISTFKLVGINGKPESEFWNG
jgi:hypothetical protein